MELTSSNNLAITQQSTSTNNQTVKKLTRSAEKQTSTLWEQKLRMGSSEL